MTSPHSISSRLILLFLVSCTARGVAQGEGVEQPSKLGNEGFEVMRQFFDYDSSVPLNARTVERLETPAYTREKIVFDGTRHGRVPGYLAFPSDRDRPSPCVLLIHGLTSSKESWWQDGSAMERLTLDLLSEGYAVFALDAEYHGERRINNDFESPLAMIDREWFVRVRDLTIQSTIEYRRGLDYLRTRPEVDTSRIGVVGYSMGGITTFILSAVETRIKVAVSCVTPVITVPYLPTAIPNYAPFITDPPFMMLMATDDSRNYTVEQAREIHDWIPHESKELIFFESGHQLPDEWILEARRWIERYLD